jgi:hypothetical protein
MSRFAPTTGCAVFAIQAYTSVVIAQAAGRGVKRMRDSEDLAAPGESVVREFLQSPGEIFVLAAGIDNIPARPGPMHVMAFFRFRPVVLAKHRQARRLPFTHSRVDSRITPKPTSAEKPDDCNLLISKGKASWPIENRSKLDSYPRIT